MGFKENLINFGRTGRGKITIIASIAAGVIFFGIGLLLYVLSANPIQPNSIDLQSSGVLTGTWQGGYILEVHSKETLISVVPNPDNANAPVKFSLNDTKCTEFSNNKSTQTVSATGTVALMLKKDLLQSATYYNFWQASNDPGIKITVICGKKQTVINVRIMPDNAATVHTVLEKQVSPTAWEAVESNKINVGSTYRINARLLLFNEVIGYGIYESSNPLYVTYFEAVSMGSKAFQGFNSADFSGAVSYIFKTNCDFCGKTFSSLPFSITL